MDSRRQQDHSSSKTIVYLKVTCSVLAMILISTILWIVGCEILWYGTSWIENVYQLKNRLYIYKIISLLLFLGLGIITVVLSASLVLLGIPFTVLHVDHLFNRKQIQLSNPARTDTGEVQTKNSKQASIWSVTIFLLVIVGLVIGGVGCEVMQWSGFRFRSLFKNINEADDKIRFYLKQWSFLAIMFAGLLLCFVGLLLAPFMLAFAGVVSFDKKRSSYRFRPQHRRQRH